MSVSHSVRPVSLTQKLAESGILITVGTLLSIWPKFDMPFGGGLTICSMLPLVILSYRHGCKWGLLSALAYGVLQCLLGMDNVMYGRNALEVLAIIFLDYIVAYLVIGFSGAFRNRIKNQWLSLTCGIAVTFVARFACHFVTGWVIWDAMWPNEWGMVAPLYSLAYNGLYMLPEMLLTCLVALAITRVLDLNTLRRPVKNA